MSRAQNSDFEDAGNDGAPIDTAVAEAQKLTPVNLTVNGKAIAVEARTMLLDALREKLALTECGACTVHVDGGIHVAHFVIDGVVRSQRHPDPPDNCDSTLDPDAIAQTYVDVLRQHRSAWPLEVEVRSWVEVLTPCVDERRRLGNSMMCRM